MSSPVAGLNDSSCPTGRFYVARSETTRMTKLLDRLGIEVPVFQAGMGGGLAGAELAAAVSEAGGLGTIGILGPRSLAEELADARRLTGSPVAVNLLLPFARPADWEAAGAADVVVTFWARLGGGLPACGFTSADRSTKPARPEQRGPTLSLPRGSRPVGTCGGRSELSTSSRPFAPRSVTFRFSPPEASRRPTTYGRGSTPVPAPSCAGRAS